MRWVVIEERAEGGDALFQAAQRDPHFLDGFVRVAEGGGVALYRATDQATPNSQLPTSKVSFPLEVGSWRLGVDQLSEAKMHREVVVPAAEIDLVAEEELVLVHEPFPHGLLPANLAADGPHVAYREANAAKHHRASRPPVGHEPVVVGDVVLEDELADLAVMPVEGAECLRRRRE